MLRIRNTRDTFLIILAWAACFVFPGSLPVAQAEGWMFRRSYYSHELPDGVESNHPRPHSRSAYRRAYVGSGYGFAVRGGYRISRTHLRVGNSVDTTVVHEGWYNIRP